MTLDVLLEVVGLKALPRTGWVRKGIDRPESVAGHSWGVSFLVLALLPDDLDQQRALTYAVLHDLPEVRVGDITPHDPVPRAEKVRREREAVHALGGTSARGQALAALWDRYETQADAEARFVKQLDRLDMALQAVHYATQTDEDLSEFVASAAKVVDHPTLQPLMDELQRRVS